MLVSTVITSYNKGPYLAEAIESALFQDIEQHEVIVIDDGSKDNTREVCESFGDRIVYHYQTNAGQCAAKNKGVALGTGKYVAFLDGDDVWVKDKLKYQVEAFEQSDKIGVVYTDRLIFNKDRVVTPTNKTMHTPREGKVTEHLISNNFVPFSSALVRRDFLEQVNGIDESRRIAPDYDLWLRMSTICEFAYVDKVLLRYRVGIDRIGAHNPSKIEHTIRIQRDFVETHFDGKFPYPQALKQAYSNKYVSHANHCLTMGQSFEAFKYFVKAARHMPMQVSAYRGMVRSLIPNGLMKWIPRSATNQ